MPFNHESVPGGLSRDSMGVYMHTPTGILTADVATPTPITSPKTSLGTVVVTLMVPPTATACVIVPVAQVRFGDNITLDGTAGHGYSVAPGGVQTPIPCVRMDKLYFRIDAVAGTTTLYFHFETLK